MSDQGLDQALSSLRLRQPGVVVYFSGIATSVLTEMLGGGYGETAWGKDGRGYHPE